MFKMILNITEAVVVVVVVVFVFVVVVRSEF
jgi:hypothetical protein